MNIPGSRLRHINRYTKVVMTLLKYGFSDLVHNTVLNNLVPNSEKLVPTREGKSVFSVGRYERIRLVMEELGTTFIKFGQILSNRPDLLPEELIKEFEKFQDHVAPVPTEIIREILEEEYDVPVEEIFEKFEFKPLASASIAQVHVAFLKNGTKVILKIQRPGIKANIESDIELMKDLAGIMLDKFPEMEIYRPFDMIRMFERSIAKELKFSSEISNLIRFKNNFADNPKIYVPGVHSKLCTQKIICMEFIDGLKASDIKGIRAAGIDPHKVALDGIDLYFQQIFEHGFFHADPHPGNFFILRDGRICFLDFGMMGTIVESDKLLLGDLMLGLAQRDVDRLKEIMMEYSDDPRIHERNQLEYDIVDFFEEYPETPIGELDSEDIMDGLNIMLYDYKIRIPQNLLLLIKALVIIEGVGLQLDPKYNIIKNMEPYIETLLTRKYDPKLALKKTVETVKNLSYLTIGLPQDLKNVLNKVKEGKLHIEYEAKGLEPLQETLNNFSKRISFAMVLAGLFISSSLIIFADIPPQINGIPLIGLIGFILSGLFSIRFMMSIFKKKGF